MTPARWAGAAVAVGLSALLLTSCANAGTPAPAETNPPGATSAPEPGTGPETPAGPDDVAAPATGTTTCETMIPEDLLAQMKSQKWSFKQSPFAAGGVTLSEGMQCGWANYEAPSGSIMLFGWAPISADEAEKMQRGLGEAGWRRAVEGDVTYITEDPTQAPTLDPDGYGMTYEFRDGWVSVADTRQALLLIQIPQG